MSTVSPVPSFTGLFLRRWTGPVLLLAAPLQFALGQFILGVHPARPLNLLGAIGLVIVMTCSLTLVAGLGETGTCYSRNSPASVETSPQETAAAFLPAATSAGF